MTSTFPIRQPCPPDACTCGHERLLEMPGADLRLTRQEEKRLLERLENLESLADLERMQRRMYEQLGIHLNIAPGFNEVRSMRAASSVSLRHSSNSRSAWPESLAAAWRSSTRPRSISSCVAMLSTGNTRVSSSS